MIGRKCGFIFLVLLAVISLVSGCGKKSSEPENKAKIIFVTAPAGASVYFDNQFMGQTGNIPDVQLQSGEGALVVMAEGGMHTYRIELSGYMTESDKSYNVVGTSTKQIRRELRRLVTVIINTSPDGASISLDSDTWSGTSPATLEEVSAGEHSLSISKSQYFILSESISVGKDQPSVSFSYELTPKPEVRTFEFSTTSSIPANNGKTPPFKLETFRGGTGGDATIRILVNAIFSEAAP